PRHLAPLDDVRTRALIPCNRTRCPSLPGRANRWNVVLRITRGTAAGTARAPREIDRHRPAAPAQPAPVLRTVHALPPCRRVGQLTLGVGSNRRTQPRERRIGRHSGNIVPVRLFSSAVLKRSQLGNGECLGNPPPVLPCGTFRGNQLVVRTFLLHTALRGGV